jgi:hypothetical protein
LPVPAAALLDEERLSELLDATFDHLMERRLGELIDADTLVQVLDLVATPERLTLLSERLVRPLRERALQRLERSDLPLGVWLPPTVSAALGAWLAQPVVLPRPWVERAVGSERVRVAVKQLLDESLRNIVEKATKATPGGKSLRGIASLASSAGRGLLGGLGDGMQQLFEERLREFLDVGVSLVQSRIVQRLTSDETARQLGQRRQQLFVEGQRRLEREVGQLLGRVPWELVDGMLPSIVQHNLGRAPVREALLEELRLGIEELSRTHLGELLDAFGLRELARSTFRVRALPVAQSLLRSSAWQAWFTRALLGS